MTITFTDRPQKFSPSHRCRKGFCKSLLVVDLDTGSVRAEARFYRPRTNVYCCLWIHGQNRQGSGWGCEAGAFASAVYNAGIDRVGYLIGYETNDLLAVCVMDTIGLALGLRNFKVLEVHP